MSVIWQKNTTQNFIGRNYLNLGVEETLQIPYRKENLGVQNVEGWPVEKINYVPVELKEKLIPTLQAPWKKFQTNLEKKYGTEVANRWRSNPVLKVASLRFLSAHSILY